MNVKKFLRSVYHYLVFFLLIAFVITCCMMLFVNTMSKNLNIELTGENLTTAAKLTFINVIFLSFIYTVIDAVRRKITVDRPVKRIIDATERIMQGDFSVRIPLEGKFEDDNGFNRISKCFNKMAEELSGIETLRTDFIANVSHELKTPLAVMQNYGAMLTAQKLPEEQRKEYANAIVTASGRLADLISNILKLNKLENQQIFPETKSYNLGEQLCECLLSFEDEWMRKKLKIETNIEEDVIVRADSELQALVWNNLFSNAIKFTNQQGKISVHLKTDKEFVMVRISDTGCGISREVGKHIFEKFYQGDTSHSLSGNGLGLALVKRVVDITGSEISVDSEVGKGSTFTVKMRREADGKS